MSTESKSETRLAANRAWKLRNKEHISEYRKRRWLLISSDPDLLTKKRDQDRKSRKKHAAKRKHYDLNRDKTKMRARGTVRNHVHRGKLKRLPCLVCGSPKSQAHHEDYSKPLEITWLCQKHHKEVHNAK